MQGSEGRFDPWTVTELTRLIGLDRSTKNSMRRRVEIKCKWAEINLGEPFVALGKGFWSPSVHRILVHRDPAWRVDYESQLSYGQFSN
jgi:hypothetical protein